MKTDINDTTKQDHDTDKMVQYNNIVQLYSTTL
jgi:hypothetical protein